MKNPMFAAGIAMLSACSQPLTESQRANVEEMVHEAELLLPAAQHLARSAQPLVDAEGNTVNDNEKTAADMQETVELVRDLFDSDSIRAWYQEDGGTYGRHPWDITPHTIEGQFIYLNSAKEEGWSGSPLVHEAGHRFQSHTLEMYRVVRAEESWENGAEDFAHAILEEQDYPYTIEMLFGAISFSVQETADSLSRSIETLEEKYKLGEITEDEYEERLSGLYLGASEKTRETWSAERAASYYADIRVLDVLGVPESALAEALQTEGVYEFTQEKITEVYEEARREVKEGAEAKSEVEYERRGEKRSRR